MRKIKFTFLFFYDIILNGVLFVYICLSDL